MDVAGVLADLFGRIDEHVDEVLDGLGPDELTATVRPETNPIGWLVWHLTRVLDHQLCEAMGVEQLWVTGPWAPRFGLRPEPDNLGYGHTPAEVAAVRPEGVDALVEYHRAVSARIGDFLAALTAADLDRVVDRNWDPPVTLGVRLVSVADDAIQHAGQAAYLRGLLAG